MKEIEYVIEIWDPLHNRYIPSWRGESLDWADVMYNKPYNKRHTRRLIMITKEIIFKSKGNAKG